MVKKIIKYEGTPLGSWMVTFSDMNTLLLTFFVLLFSMSSLATDQFEEIFQPNRGDGLGLLSDESKAYSSTIHFDPFPLLPKSAPKSALNVFRSEEDEKGKTVGIPAGVEFKISPGLNGTITIMLADKLLFPPGSTELSEESRDFLDKVQLFLQKILTITPRRVMVEGHTDNTTPVDEGYRISAKRAEVVLLYLLKDETLPPELFSVIGWGASKPLVLNNSDENRAKNRRVRIILEPSDEPNNNPIY